MANAGHLNSGSTSMSVQFAPAPSHGKVNVMGIEIHQIDERLEPECDTRMGGHEVHQSLDDSQREAK